MRNKRGITLIALIITIIILLILAGVSLNVIVGDNGVLTQVRKASEKTNEASSIEEVQLAYAAIVSEYYKDYSSNASLKKWDYLTQEKLAAELNSVGTINDFIRDDSNEEIEIIYTSNGKNESYDLVIKKDGTVKPVKILESGERAEGVCGKYLNVRIPEGFTVSGIPEEATSVDNGIVIYDIPSNVDTKRENFWTETVTIGDKTYPKVQTEYNQFVWIPVENTILDLTSYNYEELSDDIIKNLVANAKNSEGQTIYPMSIKLKNAEDRIEYISVLYGFADYNSENKTTSVTPYINWTPISKEKYREPDVVPTYDWAIEYLQIMNNILETNYSTNEDFLMELKKDFQTIVDKIDFNKGFFISRYEMSLNINEEVQSKRGSISVVSSNNLTDAEDSYYRWYGIYGLAHTYIASNHNIRSDMIFGCMWNQMLIHFAKNGINVTSTAGENNLDVTGSSTERNISEDRITGSNNLDKLCNIYDLFGNSYEWTIETGYSSARYGYGGSNNEALSLKNRKNMDANNYNNSSSTRLILY